MSNSDTITVRQFLMRCQSTNQMLDTLNEENEVSLQKIWEHRTTWQKIDTDQIIENCFETPSFKQIKTLLSKKNSPEDNLLSMRFLALAATNISVNYVNLDEEYSALNVNIMMELVEQGESPDTNSAPIHEKIAQKDTLKGEISAKTAEILQGLFNDAESAFPKVKGKRPCYSKGTSRTIFTMIDPE